MRVLFVAVLALAACQRPAPPAVAPAAPAAPVIALVSLNCGSRASLGIIEGVIRNTGPDTIESPQAFLEVDGEVMAVPVTPLTLPAGSLGSFSAAPGGASDNHACRLVGVQDRAGRALL
jgi:hypothetical protein